MFLAITDRGRSYGDLSGRENIELAARLYARDPKAAFDACRERFELGAFAERVLARPAVQEALREEGIKEPFV